MTPVRLEPAALRSRVKHSTSEPLRSPNIHTAGEGANSTVIQCAHEQSLNSCLLIASNGSPMYKSLTKTKKVLRA